MQDFNVDSDGNGITDRLESKYSTQPGNSYYGYNPNQAQKQEDKKADTNWYPAIFDNMAHKFVMPDRTLTRKALLVCMSALLLTTPGGIAIVGVAGVAGGLWFAKNAINKMPNTNNDIAAEKQPNTLRGSLDKTLKAIKSNSLFKQLKKLNQYKVFGISVGKVIIDIASLTAVVGIASIPVIGVPMLGAAAAMSATLWFYNDRKDNRNIFVEPPNSNANIQNTPTTNTNDLDNNLGKSKEKNNDLVIVKESDLQNQPTQTKIPTLAELRVLRKQFLDTLVQENPSTTKQSEKSFPKDTNRRDKGSRNMREM